MKRRSKIYEFTRRDGMPFSGRIVTDEKYDLPALCLLSAALGFVLAMIVLL
jgi:hypothetical protein